MDYHDLIRAAEERRATINRIFNATQKWQGNRVQYHSWRFAGVVRFISRSSKRLTYPQAAAILTTLFLSPTLSDQAICHFVKEPNARRGMSPTAQPSFLCTFCWIAQFPPSKPKSVGSKARIACETCWRSVLDLSICWVCGEIVVRGEEVVSLGWCFWHRSCFGCLLCGSRLDPPPEDELPCIDDDDTSGRVGAHGGYIDRLDLGGNQRRRGVELDYIPLCSSCEVTTDTLYQQEVMEIGIVNVARKDGGLSISRARMLAKTEMGDAHRLWAGAMQARRKCRETSDLWRRTRAFQKEQRYCQGSVQEIGYTANHRTGAASMGMGRDGNMDGLTNCGTPAESLSPLPGPLYLSVLDAMGELSFRPSKTKPLPKWMALPPSNRHQEVKPSGDTNSSLEMRNVVHDGIFVPQDSCHTLDAVTTTSGHSSTFAETNRVIDDTSDNVAIPNIEDDASTFEPVIFQVENPTCHASSDYRAARPQRSSTPYPFNTGVYRSSPNVNIPKSLLARATTAITAQAMAVPTDGDCLSTFPSQAATPLISGEERVEKRDGSEEVKPVMERFKGQKPERKCEECSR